MNEAIGQVNRGSAFGEILYSTTKRSDVNTIVEIGTWNGMGSTKCILDGIMDANKRDCSFISFECMKERYEEATQNLAKYIEVLPNFKLVNGTVISHEEFPSYDPSCMVKEWYDMDLAFSKICGCKFDMIPESLDLLLIDGGEYTGRLEFSKLFDRSRIIALDDTKLYKTSTIRSFLIGRPEFKIIEDNQTERNGYSIFERISL